MKQLNRVSFIISIILSLAGCGVYSFTGASISPEVKTVSIDFFPAYAPLAPPIAGQLFTEDLKNIFLSQTNLVLVQTDGDLQFEGAITNYTTAPVAIQGNETAALTRVLVFLIIPVRELYLVGIASGVANVTSGLFCFIIVESNLGAGIL